MKKFISVIMCAAILSAILAFAGCSNGDKPVNLAELETNQLDLTGYSLTFEDNFDGDTYDTNIWHDCTEDKVRRGGYWVHDAVSVRDSNLVITTDYREDGALGEGWYTGAIETNPVSYSGDKEFGKGFTQQYGYFEARCKVPKIYGAWAAFWMMPSNNFKGDTPGSGADGSELDIFESMYMYINDPLYQNSVTHAIHIDGYGEELKSMGSKHFYMENLYDEYHTYGLEWTPEEYVFYIDGKETWRTNTTPDKNEKGKEYSNISHVPEYLLLSCEVAGTEKDGVAYPGIAFDENGEEVTVWNGDQKNNDKSKKYEFLVDYVKVYEKN